MKQLILSLLVAFIFNASVQAKDNASVNQINHLSEDAQGYLCVTSQGTLKRFKQVIQNFIDGDRISTLKDAYSDIRCDGGLTLLQFAIHNGHQYARGIARTMVKDHHIPLNTISDYHDSELDFIRDNRRISEEAGINKSVFSNVFYLVRNTVRNPRFYDKLGKYYSDNRYAQYSCELDGTCSCDLEGEVCADVTTSENK